MEYYLQRFQALALLSAEPDWNFILVLYNKPQGPVLIRPVPTLVRTRGWPVYRGFSGFMDAGYCNVMRIWYGL